MARTIIGAGDAKAVQKYSAFLAVDAARESYFTASMMGYGPESQMPIQQLADLESDAGDKISYDLNMQLRSEPIEGDDVLAGQEESLTFYTDEVDIDQSRHGVNAGGRMTRKRTVHNLRRIARARAAEYWGRLFDETLMCYASGARGVNDDFIWRTSWTGRAGNALTAPDSEHIFYGGNATEKADLDAADTMDLTLLDRVKAHAETMGGGSAGTPMIRPIRIGGSSKWCVTLHPWSWYDMKTNTATGQWLDIQKAAAAAQGQGNPIFTGAKGEYNDIVLHCHRTVIRFSDYGAGANVLASRALFWGQQGVVMAFGSPGNGLRFDWHEELVDRGNQMVVDTGTIWGCKKATFNNLDFGVFALDVATQDPRNTA